MRSRFSARWKVGVRFEIAVFFLIVFIEAPTSTLKERKGRETDASSHGSRPFLFLNCSKCTKASDLFV